MLLNFILSLFRFFPLIISCNTCNEIKAFGAGKLNPESPTIKTIPLPAGFKHVKGNDSAFANWLLLQPLRKDRTVYLYNGCRKHNQNVQHAVLDINIGKKDLLQCADAVMKLRAGFLFQKGRSSEINFRSTTGIALNFSQWQNGYRWKEQHGKLVRVAIANPTRDSLESFELFMNTVYSYCGTYSLSRQLIPAIGGVQPGDIFIQGGFPGHAVIVVSVAKDRNGRKIFLLAQGYMPAQDIHILRNPENTELSPWYSEDEIDPLITPQWKFKKESLRRW